MSTKNVESRNATTCVEGAKAPQAGRVEPRAYHAPELHDVGKAVELVQGGGGNYADNNRSRQY